MARLARRYSSSDDELPELDTLIRRTTTRATRNSKPANNSPVKTLVPKATTASTTRRVRRLGESDQVSDNPLFKKWDSAKEGKVSGPNPKAKLRKPQVMVREIKHEVAAKSVSSSEDESDTSLGQRSSSQQIRQHVVEDVKEDFEEPSELEDEYLFSRIRELRTARSKAIIPTSIKDQLVLSKDQSGKSAGEKTRDQRQKPLVHDSEPDDQADQEDSGGEDPSLYLTAEEDSTDYSDGAASDSMDDTINQPKRASPRKLLFNRPQQPSQDKRSISLVKNAPLLRPNTTGSRETRQSSSSSKSQEFGFGSTNEAKGPRETSGSLPSPQKAGNKSTASELAETFSKLRLQLEEFSDDESPNKKDSFTTPPNTPPKLSKGLVSPSKKIQIPKTPHRPSMDAFWNQDIVNDWNEQHSPRKLILPPVNKSPTKTSPKKESKKSFAARRHTVAQDFLKELDQEITQGRISRLAESTGGVKIVWSKTLNTTAGRANWRRETIRTKKSDGTQISVAYKHHASIELAEKVIDDENRLLNVLAHEFCHLANFMISGITTNPHGKEFKAWASQCSNAFADRGINVTTKHTYEIDFKYVWECISCRAEYKRHSKSIDPQRHRCGTCKSELKQTKPVPRGGAKASKYQTFVKEQMKIVREENPGSPQKDVMKLIANKWAKQTGKSEKGGSEALASQMIDLTLGD